MNFYPSIRKIKIDLLMNRKDKEGKEPPKHLKRLFDDKIKPADFNAIEDRMLAYYMTYQIGNDSFFE